MLNERQIRVARFMAKHKYMNKIDVKRRFNLGKNTLEKWLKDPYFQEEIEDSTGDINSLAAILPEIIDLLTEHGDVEKLRIVKEANIVLNNLDLESEDL